MSEAEHEAKFSIKPDFYMVLRNTLAFCPVVHVEVEKGTATHSSILAWRIPGTEDPSGLQSMGL